MDTQQIPREAPAGSYDSTGQKQGVPAGHGMSHGFVISLIVLAAAIAGVVVWWVFLKSATPVVPSQVPTAPRLRSSQSILPPSDSTASISQSLDSITTDTLDAELQQIDKDLNSL